MQINYRQTVGDERVTVRPRSLKGPCRDRARASLLDIERVSSDPRRPVQSASIYRTQASPPTRPARHGPGQSVASLDRPLTDDHAPSRRRQGDALDRRRAR